MDEWRSTYLPDKFWPSLEELGPVVSLSRFDEEPAMAELGRLFANRIKFARVTHGLAENDPLIFFCFVDADVINAWAARLTDDIFCIIFPLSIWPKLVCFNGNLLCSAELAEYLELPAESYRRQRVESSTVRGKLILLPYSSSLNANYELGCTLAISSLTFLIFHEMGHILNGHLAAKLCESSQISECREYIKDSNELLTSQTLEFDADCFGINSSLDCFAHGTHPEMCKLFFHPRNRLAKYVLVGAHTGMKLFDALFEYDPNWTTNSTHPAAWVRIQYLATSAHFNLTRRKIGGNALEAFNGMSTDPPLKVEVAYFVMTNDRSLMDRVEDPFNLDLVLAHWKVLRPRLSEVKITRFQLADFKEMAT